MPAYKMAFPVGSRVTFIAKHSMYQPSEGTGGSLVVFWRKVGVPEDEVASGSYLVFRATGFSRDRGLLVLVPSELAVVISGLDGDRLDRRKQRQVLPELPAEICADMATSALVIGIMCGMKRLEKKRSRIKAATLEKAEQVHNPDHIPSQHESSPLGTSRKVRLSSQSAKQYPLLYRIRTSRTRQM